MPRQRDPSTASFDLDGHLFFWVTQVEARRDLQVAEALAPHGLRVPAWRTLASLRARERCTMNELAELTALERSTLSRTVDRMVEEDLVVRLADDRDLRVVRLALSAAGRRRFDEIAPHIDALNRAAVAGLPDGMEGVLRWALRQVRANLDNVGAGNGRPPTNS
jgi:DNA-binding MarR family transcriptional regulator